MSRVAEVWRNKANAKRAQHAGGFGGVADLEKKRQYRKLDPKDEDRRASNGYGMVFDRHQIHEEREAVPYSSERKRSRSRSPRGNIISKNRAPSEDDRRTVGRTSKHDRDDWRRRDRSRDYRRNEHDERRRRR